MEGAITAGCRAYQALDEAPASADPRAMADTVAPATVPIADNLRRVRERIAEAAIRAGRRPEEITLVAVSKTKPVEAVRIALAAGQTVFGENRVQEATSKFPPLRAACAFKLHIIGGLQTNKARDAVRIADVIETLDRPRLADALAAAMKAESRTPALLIEVNVGEEAQKSGVSRVDADAFIADCKGRFGPALAGLMCVPPLNVDPQPHFMWLAERASRHGLEVLSMGMSADFELAIACGATWVRVGSAIFGTR
jgi:PLP dependent protein